VLWGRTPSVSSLRTDSLLMVGRLRRGTADPAAERVWDELQRLGTPGAV
jgi:hypothetical protein